MDETFAREHNYIQILSGKLSALIYFFYVFDWYCYIQLALERMGDAAVFLFSPRALGTMCTSMELWLQTIVVFYSTSVSVDVYLRKCMVWVLLSCW